MRSTGGGSVFAKSGGRTVEVMMSEEEAGALGEAILEKVIEIGLEVRIYWQSRDG